MKNKTPNYMHTGYPGKTVDLIIHHQNEKTITVKPEPIGWTPPTEEEHKAIVKSVDELKPFEPMKQSQFEMLMFNRDQKNVNILIEYHEELLKYIEEKISEKCDAEQDLSFMVEKEALLGIQIENIKILTDALNRIALNETDCRDSDQCSAPNIAGNALCDAEMCNFNIEYCNDCNCKGKK